MTKRKTRKEKKRLILISFIIIFLLLTLFASVYKNFMTIINNKKNTELLEKEYQELLDEEDKLSSEVAKMHDPDYIARYAKEKYLYSSDKEIIIRID